MKIFVASDIHGSSYYAQKLVEKFEQEKADVMVLLGDIYYHGPRNPFPKEYNPMKVSEILNNIKDKLYVVKGNCDSEVDQMISEFQFESMHRLSILDKDIVFTHGHIYNEDNIPNEKCDILVYGHFHVNFIKKVNNTIVVNPGSISLPKENSTQGYVLIDEKAIKEIDLNGNIVDEFAL